MRRNKNLIELSRDHHHGLLLGWKIKEGLKRNVAITELVRYVLHFAGNALFSHFDEEEKQVLIYLDAGDSYRKNVIEQHLAIRGLLLEISSAVAPDKKMLLNLADKVEAHIRFEEREVFPYLERVLSEQQLDEIGKLITNIHQPYVEKYQNEFWAN